MTKHCFVCSISVNDMVRKHEEMKPPPATPPLTPRILLRYTLLQLPGFVLLALILFLFHSWFNIPVRAVLIVLGLWVAKDIILFPFVWRSYIPQEFSPLKALIGLQGVAVESLNPSGYIQLRSELWSARIARGYPNVRTGERVRVKDVEGLTLIVVPNPKTREKASIRATSRDPAKNN